jgi:integrase
MDEVLIRSFKADWVAEGKSPNTVDQMVWALRRLERNGLRLPPDLELLEAREWLARRRGQVAVPTAHFEARSLRKFSAFVAAELNEPDLLAGLKLPSVPEPMPQRTASEELVTRVLRGFVDDDSFEGVRDRALIAMLWFSGVRRGEAAMMKVANVDLIEESVLLEHVKRTATGPSSRLAPIAGAVRPLHVYIRLRKRHIHSALPGLWITRFGPMTKFGIGQAVQRRGKAAGVELGCHDLRRGMATEWLEMGGSDSGLIRAMGWNSERMLLRYTRANGGRLAVDEAKRLRERRAG